MYVCSYRKTVTFVKHRGRKEEMEIETILPPERLKADVQYLKEWMSKEPHLPKIDDEEWLTTFLHHNKYSLEKTKKKLDLYFSYRNKHPEILKNRDPTGPEMSRARIAFNLSLSDRLTKDGERILFCRFHPDASLFDIFNHLKRGFMLTDTLYLENDRHSHLLCLTDCQNLSYGHFLRALPGLKTGVDIFFTAYSDRVKAFHIINAPAHLDKVINAFRGFFPKKIAERFFIHSSPADLCKMVDENVVSSDFGGKGPSYAQYDEFSQKLLEKHKKWFLEQDDVHTNEELRRKVDDQVEDMRGSFRKLEVD